MSRRPLIDEPRERCACGNWPRFGCVQTSEDTVSSWFSCPIGQRIPGGGTRGCGKQGPECEDAYSDRATAASLWDAMRRKEKREEGQGPAARNIITEGHGKGPGHQPKGSTP